MKKISFLSLCFFCAGMILPVWASTEEDLISAYNSRFYPGVVRYAEHLVENDPSGVFTARALIYEGEALYRMGQSSKAAVILDRAEKLSGVSDELESARCYWIGRIYYDTGAYTTARQSFYDSILYGKKAGTENSVNSYYGPAVLASARVCIKLNDDKNAVSLYEYVVAHGKQYTVSDYEESCLVLAAAYLRSGNADKAEALCSRLSSASFTAITASQLHLYWGDAESELGRYKDAYNRYCEVISSGPSSLAVTALQRAYKVSSAHKDEVGTDPGDVLTQAESQFSAYPELVAEFRTRLGFDAYREGDYTKSLNYLDSAASSSSRELLQFAALYRAEITVRNTSVSGGPEKALKILDEAGQTTSLVPSDTLYLQFYASRARYAGLSGDWTVCKKAADTVLSSDSLLKTKARYWAALARYETGDFSGCVTVLSPDQPQVLPSGTISSETLLSRELYARSLAKTGNYRLADLLFSELAERGVLDNRGRIDYVKTLLHSGAFDTAAAQAAKTSGPEGVYLSGLAAFNSGRWKDAESKFTISLASPDLSSVYKSYSRFYAGYAQYREGNYKEAYESLTRFVTENQLHPLEWNALMIAARSAIQSGRYDEAFPLLDQAVKTASSESLKQDAVLLSSGAYADDGKYDTALKVLEPYRSLHTLFGIKCRYQAAQIMGKKGDLDAADQVYASLSSEVSSDPLVEAAAYRRGDLYYTSGKYSECVPRFDLYRKSWPQGQYYDAALYFSADALARSGSTDRAILLYLQLLSSSSVRTYRYGAEKSLVTLYRSSGDYGDALTYAQNLIAEYGEQAKSDGITEIVRELKALNTGADAKIVEKQAEYTKAGGLKTPAGRIAGTDLAELMSASPSTRQEGIDLAAKLLAVQKKQLETESSYAARMAFLLGVQYRALSKNEDSARRYLDAAEYFRMNSGNEDMAARSLYGAAESFDAAGLYGDARAAVKTLVSLYPATTQAQAAQSLVK